VREADIVQPNTNGGRNTQNKHKLINTMILTTTTITIGIVIITVAFYAGLHVIRHFALTIAQENHDANMEEDQREEMKRMKKERDADAAASAAFAKVEPMLATTQMKSPPSSAPSSGRLEMETASSGEV
jgi:hypothetical protein